MKEMTKTNSYLDSEYKHYIPIIFVCITAYT